MANVSASQPSPKWYQRPWSIVFLLFVVLGPLGLPLLWKSPAFSRATKIALTVVVVVYTALLLERVVLAVRAAMDLMGLALAPITVGILS